MGKFKKVIQRLTTWVTVLSLLLGSISWTGLSAFAAEKRIPQNFKDFIAITAWSLNGHQADGDTMYQLKKEDNIQASYEYEIPIGTIEGTDIQLPISHFFQGTLVSSSSDKVDVKVDGQMLVVSVKKENTNSLDTTSPSSMCVSGSSVNVTNEVISGIIVVDYSLHNGLLGEEPYLEVYPNDINTESPMLLVDSPVEFLSSVKLIKDGSNTIEIGNTKMEKNAKFTLLYYFGGENGVGGASIAGKAFEVSLPSEVTSTVPTMDITTAGGVVIAKATVTGGKVKFVFESGITGLTGIKGYFGFQCNFVKDKIGKEDSKKITFDLSTTSQDVTINFIQPKDNPVFGEKTAAASVESGKNVLTWTTKVTAKSIVKAAATFSETWIDQTYENGSLTVTASKAGSAVPVVVGPTNITDTGMSFEISNFGVYDEDCVITFTYKTEVAPEVYQRENASTVTSTTKITATEITSDVTKQGKITITPKWITKLAVVDLPAKTVEWEFTINESLIDMFNAQYDVAFGEYLTLVKDSGTGVKMYIGDSAIGTDIAITEISDSNGVVGFGYGFGTGVSSMNPLNQKVKIKFTTKISDEFFKKNQSNYEFEANAKLKWWNNITGTGTGIQKDNKWEDGAKKPTGGNTVITKSPIENPYNSSTGEITWEIVVYPLAAGGELYEQKNNVVVTDTVTSNQSFVQGSLEIWDGTDFVTYNDWNISGKVATINLNSISDKTILRLKTKVADSEIYKNATNVAYSNKVVLTGDEFTETSTSGEAKITSTFLTKKSSYSQKDHIISWEIEANTSKLPLDNAVIVDKFPAGVKLVPESFSIRKKSDSEVLGEIPSGVLNSDGNEITYDFAKTYTDGIFVSSHANGHIEDTYIIKYKTEIDDLTIFEQNNEVLLVNKVWLKGSSTLDTAPVDINYEQSKTEKVKIDVISKKAITTPNSAKIRWLVTVNQDERPLVNAVIKDNFDKLPDGTQMPGGLVLDDSDLKLIKGTRVNDVWKFDSSGNLTGTEIPVNISDFSYNTETKDFEFKLPFDNGAYQLCFTTKVTDKTNSTFNVTNTAKFINTLVNGTVKTESGSGTASVTLPFGGGSASDGGPVTVVKKEKDTNVPLEGAQYQLISNRGTLIDTKTTDATGTIKFEDLNFNTDYTLKEVKPAPGYKLDSTETTFQIPDAKGLEKTFYAEKFKTSFQFKKVAETADGTVLKDAEFKIYKTGDASKTSVQNAKSDANGIVKFTNVLYGQYTIEETKAPEGYKVSSNPITVTMTQGKEVDNFEPVLNMSEDIFINYSKLGSITMKLVDKNSPEPKEPIKDSVFEIYQNDTLIDTKTTDTNGEIVFKDLPIKTYKIKQVSTPGKYKMEKDSKDVMLELTDRDKTVVFENPLIKMNIEFTKEADRPTGKKLAGAEFKLYESTDTTFSNPIAGPVTSDKKGKVVFKDIECGDYLVTETKAPDGYEKTAEKITAAIAQGTALQGFEPQVTISSETLKNTATPGSIKIKLIDKEEGKPLEKGKFKIESEDGNKWEETTSSTGIIELSGLTMQTYTITEIEAPNKYIKDTKSYSVTLEATQDPKTANQEITVINDLVTAMIKVNVTSATRKGRSVFGAEFGIYKDINSNPLKTEISDKDGNVFFYNMPYGNYKVKQVKTIEGYLGIESQPDVEPIEVNVKDENPVELAVTNVEITGKVTVTIVDKVAGVEYTLYDEEGSILAVAKTNEEGLLVFDNVVYGNHKMKQTGAPSGYVNSDKEYDITVKNQDDKEDIVIDSVPKEDNNNSGSGGGSSSGGSSSGNLTEDKKPDANVPKQPDEDKTPKEPDTEEAEIKKPPKKPVKPKKPVQPDKDKKEKKSNNNSISNNNSGKGNNSNNSGKTDSKNFNNSSGENNRNNSSSSGKNDRNNANSSAADGKKSVNSGKESIRANKRLPQSGSFLDLGLLTALGVGLILMGSALKFKKKKVK